MNLEDDHEVAEKYRELIKSCEPRNDEYCIFEHNLTKLKKSLQNIIDNHAGDSIPLIMQRIQEAVKGADPY